MINTVSPTYAKEICTPELGCSLDGLLRSRADRLVGILNGADYGEWDPRHDSHLSHHYSPDALQGKAANKATLQKELGLQRDPQMPLIGFVGRLVAQKGIDLILAVLGNLLPQEVQFVILGTGDTDYEKALHTLAEHYPRRCHVKIGFSEALAHRIEAAADMFLMPSRYEPCGLNQIYSMRYGLETATGFVFDESTAAALSEALQRALNLYRDNPQGWLKLMHNAMGRDYSWRHSASAYLDLYQQALVHQEQANSPKAV